VKEGKVAYLDLSINKYINEGEGEDGIIIIRLPACVGKRVRVL
jgi:hypothetical protein